MSTIGKPERATQNRVIALFVKELGYDYLGDWSDRPGNSHIEEDLLTANLTRRGYFVVHEMVHLLEPTHNERFMPNCRNRKNFLNSLPVRHETWEY